MLYRPRDRWSIVSRFLTGSVPQPAAAGDETPERLAAASLRIDAAFHALRESILRAKLDSLVVLVADRARTFDDANTPQIHVHAGDSIWGETALTQAGEPSAIRHLPCDSAGADLAIEELFDAGFDVAESHGDFRPRGDAERGAVPALVELMHGLDAGLPVVPLHLNCHVAPALRGWRAHEFGGALGQALAHSGRRFGVLASGGMSGDPHGYMAGWTDPELDRWVLRRLETGRSAKVASMFDVQSNALRGNSAELRLWLAAAAAMEQAGGAGRTIDYFPLHAAATGVGFFTWETR
ncbi:hypothetical protein [Ramlibacter sp.]|uniref:DODA-type extradiol aromatic ring-opening family dioxygenase n=1 Tax=Ramlibacter sp. TaxID=1917967 RepID=UPI003D09C7A3